MYIQRRRGGKRGENLQVWLDPGSRRRSREKVSLVGGKQRGESSDREDGKAKEESRGHSSDSPSPVCQGRESGAGCEFSSARCSSIITRISPHVRDPCRFCGCNMRRPERRRDDCVVVVDLVVVRFLVRRGGGRMH